MPHQMKEVEITEHHRPTEYVKAAWWAFVAVASILSLCLLFIQKPHSFWSFLNDLMNDFVVVVILFIIIGAGFLIGVAMLLANKAKVVDVGQFGTVIKQGKKTIELAPIMPENLPAPPSVNLVTPSAKAGKFLPYKELADYLQAKGVELSDLEECFDQTEPSDEYEEPQPVVGLTELQKRVLDEWEKGHRGRLSIHKADPTISEHIASRTIAELKGKGLIQ